MHVSENTVVYSYEWSLSTLCAAVLHKQSRTCPRDSTVDFACHN